MSAISKTIRKRFGEGDRIRDAGLTTPDDVQRYDDIVYGKSRKWQILDVYRPKGVEGKLPVIINVHGGGWVYGSKEVYQFYCMSLAQRGFAVVNFTYRLAPEYRYPSCVEDTNKVVKWVLKNDEEYGFDLNNVFAVGDSAGGQILSVYSAMLTNPKFAEEYGLKLPKKFRFNAIGLNCGRYKGDPKEAESLSNSLMREVLPADWSGKDLYKFDCAGHVTTDFPPCFLMTSVGDMLKDQPEKLIPDLIRNDVPFTFRFYGDKNNKLGHVFHCNMRSADAAMCNDEECEFFRKYMK